MNNRAIEMEKKIKKLSGKYSVGDVFDDFLTCTHASICNAVNFSQEVEDEYMRVIKKYTKEEVNVFVELFAMLTLALEDGIDDILGTLYMRLGISNNYSGQFFTPFHVATLTAKMTMNQDGYEKEQSFLDPCCGAGSMPLAMCKALKDEDVNFQQKLRITCKDIDIRCVKMCYIQLALVGATAKVICGDSLLNTETAVFYTPMYRIRGLQLA